MDEEDPREQHARQRQSSDPGTPVEELMRVAEGQLVHPVVWARHSRPRSVSMFIQRPVGRESYASLPQSPAVSFLSMVAENSSFMPEEQTAGTLNENDIVEKYLVGRQLGRGAFSECRCGVEIDTGVDVALKIVATGCPAMARDFERELQIWSRLAHERMLPLLDYFQTGDLLVAVSPLILPGSLLQHLLDNHPEGLSEADAVHIFRQVCRGIDYLHNTVRMAHCDLKLENILLDGAKDVFLCDFGMCVELGGEGALEEQPPIDQGSLMYVPPEYLMPELRPAEQAPCKADVWSLGVVLYALLMGRLPFNDEFAPKLQHAIIAGNYARLHSHIRADLHVLVDSLLQSNPRRRPLIGEVLEHPALSPAETQFNR